MAVYEGGLLSSFVYKYSHKSALSVDDVHDSPPLGLQRRLLGCEFGSEVVKGGVWRCGVGVQSG